MGRSMCVYVERGISLDAKYGVAHMLASTEWEWNGGTAAEVEMRWAGVVKYGTLPRTGWYARVWVGKRTIAVQHYPDGWHLVIKQKKRWAFKVLIGVVYKGEYFAHVG